MGAQIVQVGNAEREREERETREKGATNDVIFSSAAPGLLLRPRPHDGERFPLRLHSGLWQLLGWG